MSGDIHDSDDADFLDEDFVVEDIAGKNEDLEDLFVAPGPGSAPAAQAAPAAREAEVRGDDVPPDGPSDAPGDDAAVAATPDEEDMLFTDHTVGIDPSERFGERPGFAEQASSEWNGEALELDDEVGVPATSAAAEAAAFDVELAKAKDSFTAELDSMLRAEEDFELDSDKDLEVIRDEAAGDGISEFEQSGPFVLDDGDTLWRDELAEREAAQPVGREVPVDDDAGVEAGADDEVALPLREAAQFADEGEPDGGWEPLPGTTVDQLSEVGEVQRADGDYGDESDVAVAAAPGSEDLEDLGDVEGHDIYAEEDDEAVVVGGAAVRSRRVLHLFASLAASLLILGGGAAVVMRPEWFGLEIAPERIERVEVPRPRVVVAVEEPPAPATVVAPGDPDDGGQPPASGGDPSGSDPSGSDPSGSDPTTDPGVPPVEPVLPGDPGAPTDPGSPTGTGPGTDPAAPSDGGAAGAGGTATTPTVPAGGGIAGTTPGGGAGPDGVGVGTDPVAVGPSTAPSTAPDVPVVPDAPQGVIEAPPGGPTTTAWPVANGPVAAGTSTDGGQPLVRFGEGLLVGQLGSAGDRPVAAVDGVLPGARAFAQLRNGNYFIGSVKCVVGDTITLHVEQGEVTLATAEIVSLTELGSADYEALQKATSGFVRLTNNNRLIGGILSRIADDHVVLEFRSNRVMLPKSAVGEIVQGEAESAVRLDTTHEEDSWLQKLVERQLGTGKGVAVEGEPAGSDATRRAGGPPR